MVSAKKDQGKCISIRPYFRSASEQFVAALQAAYQLGLVLT